LEQKPPARPKVKPTQIHGSTLRHPRRVSATPKMSGASPALLDYVSKNTGSFPPQIGAERANEGGDEAANLPL
jgi:hypothetical protein